MSFGRNTLWQIGLIHFDVVDRIYPNPIPHNGSRHEGAILMSLNTVSTKTASTNLFNLELKNIEEGGLHKPADSSRNKRNDNHRKLAARRAIEDHLEQQRLRSEYQDIELEVY